MFGISAYGAYIPMMRLQRSAIADAHAWLMPALKARSTRFRSLGDWDEDAITLAVEAARSALPQEDRSELDQLVFASTTAPFDLRLNAGIVAAALDLNPKTVCQDASGSERAGLSSLITALTTRAGTTLIAAADRLRPKPASTAEIEVGHASAAIVTSDQDVVAEYLGHASHTEDFVDRFRGAGEIADYAWEERWVRDAGYLSIAPPVISDALQAAEVAAAELNHFIFACPMAGVANKLAKTLGTRSEAVSDPLRDSCGFAGTAHSLLMLADVLGRAEPGETVLVSQFGQGCDALVLRASDRLSEMRSDRDVDYWLARSRSEKNYTKRLVFDRQLDWDTGMRGERDNKTALTTLHRGRRAILGLVGSKCTETGTVQYPPSRLSVTPNNPALDTQESYRLAEKSARIVSWSADHLSFSPHPPNHVGLIDFEGGGRMPVSFTDVSEGELETGGSVRMVFRIKDFDEARGFTRYFWKAQPIRNREEEDH